MKTRTNQIKCKKCNTIIDIKPFPNKLKTDMTIKCPMSDCRAPVLIQAKRVKS